MGGDGSGRRPVDPWTVEQIQIGLAGGQSQQALGRLWGVSRGTVAKIAAGTHPSLGANLARCRGCRMKTLQPCQVCRARAHAAARLTARLARELAALERIERPA